MRKPYNLVQFDGEKAVTLFGDEGWTIQGGVSQPDSSSYLSSRVAIVYRAMHVRANAVANIPFDLINKNTGNVVDSSDDWKNVCEFMPSPELLFYLIESAWVLYGKAYLYQAHNDFGYKKILKYIAPGTVTYDLQKDIFTRTQLDGIPKDYQPAIARGKTAINKGDSIVPLWMPDPDVEYGEPTRCPAKAALAAMGVLYNFDQAGIKYFKNGMLHTMLFAVPPGTSKEAKDEFEERMKGLRGIGNAFKALFVNADDVKPVDMGGHLSDLENESLTKEKREDVAIALGVPMTKLFTESAAGLGGAGVSDGDDRRLVADTALPDWQLIARELNRQVFEPLGYRLIDRHKDMEIFQENRSSLTQSLQSLVSAFKEDIDMGLIMARHLGINFDDQSISELQALAKSKEEAKPVIEEKPVEQPEEPEEDDKPDQQTEELMKFKRKALKKVGTAVSFESAILPVSITDEITAQLSECKTASEVKAVFDQYMDAPIKQVEQDSELKRSNDLLEKLVALKSEPVVQVQAPDNYTFNIPVSVTLPEQQPPNVNITNDVNPTPVQIENKVSMPDIPIPVVNVPAPIVNIQPAQVKVENKIEMPAKEKLNVEITRNNAGTITGMQSK